MDEINEDYDYEEEGEDEEVYYAVRPNKTQIKRERADLFKLGEELSELSSSQLTMLALPEALHKAIVEVSVMPHKGARKRQLKFIAGQLHKMDDTQTLLEHFSKIKNRNAVEVGQHHQAEFWRDRLVTGGHEALTCFFDEYPEADHNGLRQLVRNIKKEAEANKPAKSYRLLYRRLKELFQSENEGAYLEDTESIDEDFQS